MGAAAGGGDGSGRGARARRPGTAGRRCGTCAVPAEGQKRSEAVSRPRARKRKKHGKGGLGGGGAPLSRPSGAHKAPRGRETQRAAPRGPEADEERPCGCSTGCTGHRPHGADPAYWQLGVPMVLGERAELLAVEVGMEADLSDATAAAPSPRVHCCGQLTQLSPTVRLWRVPAASCRNAPPCGAPEVVGVAQLQLTIGRAQRGTTAVRQHTCSEKSASEAVRPESSAQVSGGAWEMGGNGSPCTQ